MTRFLPLFAVLLASQAMGQTLEQCSYDTEHDGKITHTIESPGEADGSNQKRFAEIQQFENEDKEGWKGYHTLNVVCRPLDNDKLDFNLFVQTNNGQISLIHGLTEAACYHALYAADNHRNAPNGSSWIVQQSDFERGECFR
jgi:hypothetical protein